MASESVIIVAALLLLNIVMANRVPFEPPAAAAVAATTQDQYEMGEDRPRKSTDHLLKSPDSINPENIAITNNEDLYESKKKKRSYYPYPIPAIQSVSAYHSVSIWQPPPYQLSRPYFIPIYGIHGQIPIYYPPQPLFVYPQQPVYTGPEYLPPKQTNTTEKPTDTTTMTIGDRFNNFDEQPVWDVVTTTTENPRSSNNIVPTRRPRPQRVSTHPPLIHDATTTRRPEVAPPPSIEASGGAFAPSNQQQQVGPSRCVWAIVSCCSRGRNVPTECFEFHGCPGPFWDASPCESEFAKAAIETALKYYNSK